MLLLCPEWRDRRSNAELSQIAGAVVRHAMPVEPPPRRSDRVFDQGGAQASAADELSGLRLAGGNEKLARLTATRCIQGPGATIASIRSGSRQTRISTSCANSSAVNGSPTSRVKRPTSRGHSFRQSASTASGGTGSPFPRLKSLFLVATLTLVASQLATQIPNALVPQFVSDNDVSHRRRPSRRQNC